MAANPGEILPGACGVTCPGPIDRGIGSMKPVGMPMWHDFPIRRELADVTGLPVEVDTPGRALALAELWCGQLADVDPAQQHFATIVLGDEVDGAFVTGGVIVQGLTGNLGQFGHIVVEPDGAPCACGALGCLTTYAGSRGISASTSRELRRTPAAIVERTGIMVARACASIAAMLDVSEIVLGGDRSADLRRAVLRSGRQGIRAAQQPAPPRAAPDPRRRFRPDRPARRRRRRRPAPQVDFGADAAPASGLMRLTTNLTP